MIPPTSIDGTDITGATIDGTDVTEITVDGQTVFTSIPPDAGLHYYLADFNNGGVIEHYTLPTPYDLANRSLQFTLTGMSGSPGICLSNDGTRAVVYDGPNSGLYSQYDLSTPFELSTVTNRTDITNLPDANLGSIQFGDNGNKFYITDTGNFSFIRQYDLSTPYDITTASSSGSQNLGQGGQPGSPAFNSDGTKLIWGERIGQEIYSTPLSTAFDITTIGSVTSFSANSGDPSAVALSIDGTQLYTRHWSPSIVAEYEFGTPFDIGTLSYIQNSFSTQSDAASHQFSVNPWQV